MKRKLLFLSFFACTFGYSQDCSDLFISEYVEGWSNNKALEIYNPTNAAIDLSQYMVVRYSNGAATATAANAIQLTGSVGPYDVHVGVIEKLDPQGTGQEAPVWDSLQVRADEFYCPDYNTSNAFYWNGNDAIILYRGNVNDITNALVVDVFGKVSEDPGAAWTADFPYVATGDEVTKDHSMIRKSTILAGQTNPLPSYFDPLDEWDSIPPVITVGNLTYGNWESLGTHDCDCAESAVNTISQATVSVYPNPTESGIVYLSGTAHITNVEVVDALGKVVLSRENSGSSSFKIDLSDKKGLYILKLVSTDGKSLVKRVIVK